MLHISTKVQFSELLDFTMIKSNINYVPVAVRVADGIPNLIWDRNTSFLVLSACGYAWRLQEDTCTQQDIGIHTHTK